MPRGCSLIERLPQKMCVRNNPPAADSLSLKRFLGYPPHEETPDHSSLSRIRGRLPLEVFQEVHVFVLRVLGEHKLIDGTTVGVDSTVLEANAAMKSIVRKDSGEDWEAYVKRLAAECRRVRGR